MKQFKHKKFIGLALIVFLVFMVLGKYTQSTAFYIVFKSLCHNRCR
ncbi:MAG: hypothetical protein ACLT8L_06050 [Streptococcus salivarius]